MRSVRTETTEGQYSPVRSRASEVSKCFVIWLNFGGPYKALPVACRVDFRRDVGEFPAFDDASSTMNRLNNVRKVRFESVLMSFC